jgi:hypothetical protein
MSMALVALVVVTGRMSYHNYLVMSTSGVRWGDPLIDKLKSDESGAKSGGSGGGSGDDGGSGIELFLASHPDDGEPMERIGSGSDRHEINMNTGSTVL